MRVGEQAKRTTVGRKAVARRKAYLAKLRSTAAKRAAASRKARLRKTKPTSRTRTTIGRAAVARRKAEIAAAKRKKRKTRKKSASRKAARRSVTKRPRTKRKKKGTKMATRKQKAAARRNLRKARAALRRKKSSGRGHGRRKVKTIRRPRGRKRWPRKVTRVRSKRGRTKALRVSETRVYEGRKKRRKKGRRSSYRRRGALENPLTTTEFIVGGLAAVGGYIVTDVIDTAMATRKNQPLSQTTVAKAAPIYMDLPRLGVGLLSIAVPLGLAHVGPLAKYGVARSALQFYGVAAFVNIAGKVGKALAAKLLKNTDFGQKYFAPEIGAAALAEKLAVVKDSQKLAEDAKKAGVSGLGMLAQREGLSACCGQKVSSLVRDEDLTDEDDLMNIPNVPDVVVKGAPPVARPETPSGTRPNAPVDLVDQGPIVAQTPPANIPPSAAYQLALTPALPAGVRGLGAEPALAALAANADAFKAYASGKATQHQVAVVRSVMREHGPAIQRINQGLGQQQPAAPPAAPEPDRDPWHHLREAG